MSKEVSTESAALAGLVQVRFSGLEKRIPAAEFGYAKRSEIPGESTDSRVAEVLPPS